MKKLLLFLLLINCAPCFSQAQLEYKRLLAEFPDERAVVIKDQEDVYIDLVNGKLVVTQDNYTETMYLDSRAGMFSEHSVEHSMLDKIYNISASSLIPDKNKYKEIKVKNFTHQDKISRSVFYDGGQVISFLYPSLSAGSKTKIQFKREFTEPRLFPGYYFQRGIPVKEAVFTVTTSSDVEIDWKIFNDKNNHIQLSETKLKGNKTRYSWTYVNIPKYKNEEDAPNVRFFIPHIAVWIKSYKHEGKTIPVLGTPKELYSWYYDITKDVNKEVSQEVKHIVDSLLAGETNELEKVRKVFYWVQDNIKYIAFEDGMGGFVPRDAETVCHRRFGDCKDMASIINNMLSIAGVKSHLTWIGSRRIPYGYSEISTPVVDDHMICTYIKDNQYYFLDATGQFMPLGTPTSFIQDKEALIRIDKENFIIQKVPIPDYQTNRILDTVALTIKEEKLFGEGSTHLTGYEKINMTHKLSIGESDRLKLLREFYNKGNNKFIIDSYDIMDMGKRDKNLIIKYKFNIADYLKAYNNEIYVNLHLNKDLQKEVISPDRSLPIELEHHNEIKYIVNLKIPDGYIVSYVPESKSFKDEKFGFIIDYKKEGKNIILTETQYNKSLLLKNEDFDQWNNMIKELKKAYNEVLILKKTK
ncbi:MAG: transglutaminase-like domain-containing protein [Cytophagaceae bacterium]